MRPAFVNHKFQTTIHEDNISAWRLAICGNLTAAFLPADKWRRDGHLPYIDRDPYLTSIHQAQFRDAPNTFRNLTDHELSAAKHRPWDLADMPRQEPGTKPATPLPYEPYADLVPYRSGLTLHLGPGTLSLVKPVQEYRLRFTMERRSARMLSWLAIGLSMTSR